MNTKKKNKKENNIWLKLYGTAKNKYKSEEFYNSEIVEIDGIKKHIICFKETRKPHLNEGDIIYKGLLSIDSNKHICPIIVERGIVEGGLGEVEENWIKTYKWMRDYPIYCVLNNVENINKPVKYGVSMYDIWEILGSDTYESSVGRNEGIEKVAIKHRQKSHIRLTKEAKEIIDDKLNILFKKYGKI